MCRQASILILPISVAIYVLTAIQVFMSRETAFQPILKLGENVRIARKRRGLRIVDLARAAGWRAETPGCLSGYSLA